MNETVNLVLLFALLILFGIGTSSFVFWLAEKIRHLIVLFAIAHYNRFWFNVVCWLANDAEWAANKWGADFITMLRQRQGIK